LCVSAAETLPAEIFNGWKQISRLEVVEGLGSSEVLHIEYRRSQTCRIGRQACARHEIVLRSADGAEIGDGSEGILRVRGDSSALVLNRSDKTAETLREDGWIYTGDRFVRDADGFHFFRGRADDLVKISGQWVYMSMLAG
jgi:acyl-coenzyme A synthetase/AMP-(fatty) acid ligase